MRNYLADEEAVHAELDRKSCENRNKWHKRGTENEPEE